MGLVHGPGMDEKNCRIEAGESAQVLKGGFLRLNDGSIRPHEDCYFEEGSRFVLYYDEPSAPPEDPMSAGSTAPPTHGAANTPAPAEPPFTGLEIDAATIDAALGVEGIAQPPPTSADLVAVTNAASALGGEHAALLALALAALTIFGGRQAWRFSAERQRLNHEREMAKLKQDSQRPRSCKEAQAATDARIDQNQAHAQTTQEGLESLESDFDSLKRTIKKLKKRVQALENPPDDED